MGWDEVITGWTSTLDEIDAALAARDWRALQDVAWPEPERDLAPPPHDQLDAVRELSRRQVAAISAVQELLDAVGSELRQAERVRGAMRAYQASNRRGVDDPAA